jgi:hypothetical protein
VPKSGIYTNTTDFTSLNDFEVSVVGYLQGQWQCVYLTDYPHKVYVVNNGQGGIEISFCDLEIVTDGGCHQIHTLTGKISTN